MNVKLHIVGKISGRLESMVGTALTLKARRENRDHFRHRCQLCGLSKSFMPIRDLIAQNGSDITLSCTAMPSRSQGKGTQQVRPVIAPIFCMPPKTTSMPQAHIFRHQRPNYKRRSIPLGFDAHFRKPRCLLSLGFDILIHKHHANTRKQSKKWSI
jgi:hypothetical protein